jgi:hypothetical protein
MQLFFRKHRLTIVAALLLEVIMIAQVALSTRHLSASWDEGDHIYAGYMNWKHGEYDLNPEHPPLVKLVATLPLLELPLKTAPRQGRFFKSESYYGGRELLFRNGPDSGGSYTADALLFRTHMAVMVFSLGVALLLFVAGWELFGPIAGLIAMALWVFDPTVLANAPFVTTDTGAAFGFFASVYAFFRFTQQMTWKRMVMCGIAVGVALACKHNTVLLLPILLLLAGGDVIATWRKQQEWPGRRCLRLCVGMAGISAIALTLLWGVYSFRFAMHPVGVSMPPLVTQITTLSPVMSRLVGFCARFHLLPESYLYGLVDVVRVGTFMPTYIFGKLYAHGQWFYFPALLSLKWSEGVLGLLLMSLFAFAFGKFGRTRQVFFMVLPAIFYLGVAMASPLNIGVRHVLPVFPFVFVLIGGGTAWLISRNRVWVWPVGALLLLHIAASVRMFPNYMPYANVFWGGPAQTHLYFSDSAVEWGQDLKFVKSWTDQHKVNQCWIAHFPAPFLLPSDYGVPCKLLPTLDTMYEEDIELPPVLHGPLLISVADLNGFEFGTKVRNPYQSLFERKPDEIIANGVAIYYGDFSLPAAAALKFIEDSRSQLRKHPAEALSSAREAVALNPRGFDENMVLSDALTATGDKPGAQAACAVANSRIADMEPTAQQRYSPILKKKCGR